MALGSTYQSGQRHIRRRHLRGEHSRWCQKIKGKLIYCRFTDQRIGKVGK